MSKGVLRSSSKDLESQVVAALHGTRRPSAADLVELIRQVNPTGRGLPRGLEQQRYAWKSRLQSELLRRFDQEIEILVEAGQPGVLLLRHRYVDRGDAAHAVLAELDEDVRAAVQRRLDLATAESAADAPAAPAGMRIDAPGPAVAASCAHAMVLSWQEHLAHGQTALDGYDLEAARMHLDAAVHGSGGDARAALPLCVLLVEHLMADAEALDLVPSLSSEAVADPRVRALLALAAARVGAGPDVHGDVVRWLRGVPDAAAAGVFLALTDRRLRESDADEAAACLRHAAERGAQAMEIVQKEAEIAQLRRSTWHGAEAALEQMLAEGAVLRALPEARALIARWPESKAARRVVAAAEALQRKEEGLRLVRAAEHALAEGELVRAAELAEAARGVGAETAALDRAIQGAVTAARVQQEQAQVAALLQRLHALPGGEGRAALLEYLKLPARLRAEVRDGAQIAMLAWLEEIDGTGTRAAAAVEAVLALQAAEGLHEPADVLAALAPHDKALTRIGRARMMASAARAEISSRRRHQAEACLEAAQRALAQDDLEGARQRLDAMDAKALGAAGAEQQQSLRAQLAHREEIQQRTAAFFRCRDAEMLFEAEREAGALAGLCEPARAEWAAWQDAMKRRIAETWRLCEFPGDATPLSAVPHAGAVISASCAGFLAMPLISGDELTLAAAFARWLFLWHLDARSGLLRRATVLHVPADLGPQASVSRHRDEVWVCGSKHLAILAVEAGKTVIRAWHDFTGEFGEYEEVETACVLPEAGTVWLAVKGGLKARTLVADLPRGRQRRIETDTNLVPLIGGKRPRMATLGLKLAGGYLRLYDATGVPVEQPDMGDIVLSVAVHPDGERIVALIGRNRGDDEFEIALLESGRSGQTCVLPDATVLIRTVCTAREPGLVFVAYYQQDGEGSLLPALCAYRPGSAGCEAVWHTRLHTALVFAHDAAAQRAVALLPTEFGGALAVLGPEPPPAPPHISLPRRLPPLAGRLNCEGPGFELSGERRAQIGALDLTPRSHRQLELARALERGSFEPVWLLGFAKELPLDRQADYIESISSILSDKDGVLLALCRACCQARLREWDAVRELLGSIDIEQLGEPYRRHALHLLGIVRMRAADLPGARAAWQRALELPGGCNTDECIAWLDALDTASRGEITTLNLLHPLAVALRTADARLEEGDAEGARQALERTGILVADEGQSLARLAAAYLQLTPTSAIGEHGKGAALARFCAWAQRPDGAEVFLPAIHWERARLQSLRNEAEAWLTTRFTRSATD